MILLTWYIGLMLFVIIGLQSMIYVRRRRELREQERRLTELLVRIRLRAGRRR